MGGDLLVLGTVNDARRRIAKKVFKAQSLTPGSIIRQPLLVNELPKTDRWKTVILMLLEHIKYHLIPTPITYTCITKYRKTLYKAQLMFDSQINKMGFGPEITFTHISKGRAQVSANQQPCALRPKRSRKNLIT